MFDRRESGVSGGRVERVTRADYAAQGKGLLDHLGVARAHLMVLRGRRLFAATWPQAAASMVLYSPAVGARYRIAPYARFARHPSFVSERDLVTVVDLALCSGQGSRRTRASAGG